jgi:CHASE3 domain sensor protein
LLLGLGLAALLLTFLTCRQLQLQRNNHSHSSIISLTQVHEEHHQATSDMEGEANVPQGHGVC